MLAVYIPRNLVVGEEQFTEESVLQRGRVFIVLAEPGAGKTELLKTLANLLQTTRIKASVYRSRPQSSGAGPLVIDAMDEVARIDSLATDEIIARASSATEAAVIFAGRSSEWDEGRTAYVEHCFGERPVVVRLEPFGESEQRQLFTAEYPDESFDDFVQEVERFELGPLLGNPQFLQLLGAAYIESERVFTSKAKIFADAVRRLAHEANPELGRQKTRPPADELVALGSEVFAKLMLSGATGLATVETLSDQNFPYINSLCRESSQVAFLIDTRLLRPSDDSDKHEPIHRIVAEYCAARYLVSRIEDSADRLSLERVLAIVAPNRTTRDELRGMLGWMAALGHEPLQFAAIKIDAYAVLANGDPSQLTAAAKGTLLDALEELAERDPMFRRSDTWRRFNVGHFFTVDVLDHVRAILQKAGTLRPLVLELLIRTDAASNVLPELAAIQNDAAVDGSTRKLAMTALLSANEYAPANDAPKLVTEASADSLEIASRMVAARGVAAFGVPMVCMLLSKLGALFSAPKARDVSGSTRYFVDRLVQSFSLADVTTFLDSLTIDLTCTCFPKHELQCTCRSGPSKIVGKLLDRYFGLTPDRHDPEKIWLWLKALHFQRGLKSDRSAAVKYLGEDHDLRRSLQRLAVQGATSDDAARSAVTKLYLDHVHSGIQMHEGDQLALSQYAFDQGLIDLWTALLSGHNFYSRIKGPNPTRALQREQSRLSPPFLAAWSRRERMQRELQKEDWRFSRGHKRYAEREAMSQEKHRSDLRNNLTQIEAGQHFGWLRHFAQTYLLEPNKLGELVDDPDTPLRALRNGFPILAPVTPTLDALGRRERPDIAEMLLAICVLHFREGGSLGEIDQRLLEAAKSEASSYPTFSEGEGEAFEAALDAALFRAPADAETYLRCYMEARLPEAETTPIQLYWLDHKLAFQHLRSTLPLEWLERFPQFPIDGVRFLFDLAAKFGDRKELLALIDRRMADPLADNGEATPVDKQASARKTFWELSAFLYHSPGRDIAWSNLKTDPKVIFALEHKLGRLHSAEESARPPTRAETVFQIMDAYVDVWPKVALPSRWGTGDPENETAYRFLQEIVWKIAEDTPDQRVPVLERMVSDPKFADFRKALLTLLAEANRQIALQDFRAPSPSAINKLLDENGVASVEDLRALMVEELSALQTWLNGSETDPLDAFYSGGKRVDENTARNRIVDQLQGRMQAMGLSIVIERHMSDSKRCDITASAIIEGASLLLVTEVKGQWNRELYTAPSAQLDELYTIHPNAARQGIYLALWYGNGETVAGRSDPEITTAAELKAEIINGMPEELRRRIDVFVLDLSRPLMNIDGGNK